MQLFWDSLPSTSIGRCVHISLLHSYITGVQLKYEMYNTGLNGKVLEKSRAHFSQRICTSDCYLYSDKCSRLEIWIYFYNSSLFAKGGNAILVFAAALFSSAVGPCLSVLRSSFVLLIIIVIIALIECFACEMRFAVTFNKTKRCELDRGGVRGRFMSFITLKPNWVFLCEVHFWHFSMKTKNYKHVNNYNAISIDYF